MTENILLFLQFLVVFSGIVYQVINIVKALMFSEIQELKEQLKQLNKRVEHINKSYEKST